MADQRFKYYTGYEVDNEPSDDDDELETPSSTAIAQGHRSSESSDEEFDRPIRDFIEKTLPQSTASTTRKTKTNTSHNSNAFENEMEDELDQIYHNFISRGTFELPLSTQKSPTKKKPVIHLQEAEESESDDENNQGQLSKTDDQEKNDDDLLYDPDEEEEDEKWMTNQRIKSQGGSTDDKANRTALGPTDAVLNCPGCMVLISHDCQRHETIKNQYRAMFVFNCTVDENRIAPVPNSSGGKSAKNKRNRQNKRLKTDESSSAEPNEAEEILRPVICSECGTEIGVYEPKEELYHFANVLASH